MPLALSDDEMMVLLDAARPIQPHQRDQFLRAVAAELSRYPELGVGLVSRTVARLQREHLAPRAFRNGVNKWNG